MNPTDQAVQELNTMLDDGVTVRVTPREGQDTYALRVELDDAGCGDCLVPDDTLRLIATDALQRRGVVVADLVIEHPPA